MLILILILEILLVLFYLISSIAKRSFIDRKTVFYSLPVFLIAFLCNTYAYLNYASDPYSFVSFSQTVIASIKVFAFEIKESWAILAAESSLLFKIELYFITVVGGLTLISSIGGFFKFYIANVLSLILRVCKTSRRSLANKINIIRPDYVYRQVNRDVALKTNLNEKCDFAFPKHYHDLVLGLNERAITYCKLNRHAILYIDPKHNRLDNETRKMLYVNHIPYLYHSLTAKNFNRLFFLRGNINLIAFDYQEDKLVDLYELIKDAKTNKHKQLTLLVEINSHNYSRIEEEMAALVKDRTYVSTNVFNRHDLISREFSLQHNFAKYLPRHFYEKAPNPYALKTTSKINVHIVGFGKTGNALLESVLLNNQFMSVNQNAMHTHPFNLYLYDKQIENTIKHHHFLNFHETYYTKNNLKKYLPLPDTTFVFNHCQTMNIDLDDQNSLLHFYKHLHSLTQEDAYNFIIICLDNDINNRHLARAINEQLKNINNQYLIFYNSDNHVDMKQDDTHLIPFGYKNELLKHDIICNDEVVLCAINNDLIYKIKQLDPNKINETDFSVINPHNFYQLPLIQKKSNIYQRINLEFKLNVMGLGLTTDKKNQGITIDTFNQYYQTNALERGSVASFLDAHNKNNALGFLEHARWCMFYELNYYTQLEKALLSSKRKDEDKKQHGCLTSWTGLEEFLKCSKTTSLRIYQNDFYPIEYAYPLLTQLGYQIYQRSKDNE